MFSTIRKKHICKSLKKNIKKKRKKNICQKWHPKGFKKSEYYAGIIFWIQWHIIVELRDINDIIRKNWEG